MLHDAGIRLKTRVDMLRMRRPAIALHRIFRALVSVVTPGCTGMAIDAFVRERLEGEGVRPAHPGFNAFPAATCVSTGSIVAHGIPDDKPIEAGSLVTVDIGGELDGWYADGAWTYEVGDVCDEYRRLRVAAWRCAVAAVRVCRAGGRLGDIGYASAQMAEREGFRVVEDFAGHGIGRALHEPPTVLHVGRAELGLQLRPGMVLNVEPVLVRGATATQIARDGFAYRTTDGGAGAQFELTVGISAGASRVLSLPDENPQRLPSEPPF